MDPVESFFGAGGVLARAHPANEPRPGQQEIAERGARVLGAGGRAMIEAGTGTGKTLAYLVPALAAGRRVIVSTGTRNLQDQIWDKDLPLLRERAGLAVSACVMKGRENYVCRYRIFDRHRQRVRKKARAGELRAGKPGCDEENEREEPRAQRHSPAAGR
jgi:ATP-dependent DNA helicase DinG